MFLGMHYPEIFNAPRPQKQAEAKPAKPVKLSKKQRETLALAVAYQLERCSIWDRREDWPFEATLQDANLATLRALERRGFVESFETDGIEWWPLDDAGLGGTYWQLTEAAFAVEPDFDALDDFFYRPSNECPKCGGTGYIPEYSHIQGGVCFACNGTGRGK